MKYTILDTLAFSSIPLSLLIKHKIKTLKSYMVMGGKNILTSTSTIEYTPDMVKAQTKDITGTNNTHEYIFDDGKITQMLISGCIPKQANKHIKSVFKYCDNGVFMVTDNRPRQYEFNKLFLFKDDSINSIVYDIEDINDINIEGYSKDEFNIDGNELHIKMFNDIETVITFNDNGDIVSTVGPYNKNKYTYMDDKILYEMEMSLDAINVAFTSVTEMFKE